VGTFEMRKNERGRAHIVLWSHEESDNGRKGAGGFLRESERETRMYTEGKGVNRGRLFRELVKKHRKVEGCELGNSQVNRWDKEEKTNSREPSRCARGKNIEAGVKKALRRKTICGGKKSCEKRNGVPGG